MGCSKNLIDSERLKKRLEAKGYATSHDPQMPCGEIVVVNTCGFIGDAKEESIEMILNLTRLKEEGQIGEIRVMGCLSERYLSELKEEIPEVDKWYGKFDWTGIVDSLPDRTVPAIPPREWERSLTTPPWSAFVKISEGCNRFCAFCAIPLITGRHTSRPIDEILEEITSLVASGVKEFNIIAQDLSSYGMDLYGESRLAELIDRMAQTPGVEWIRLHYAYPADFPMDILPVMARHDNVCKYLDIALQHIADPVLENMHRHISGDETRRLLAEIRRQVPGICIRTTLMTGFPGEGEKEFEELVSFVKEQRFERMGAFAYCEEEGTSGARLYKDSIPQDEKQHRLDMLMHVQQEIAEQINEKLTGSVLRVLVEEPVDESGAEILANTSEEENPRPYEAYARTEFDSPDVDQSVLVTDCNVRPGEFIHVVIDKAYPFELLAHRADTAAIRP